VRGRLVTSFRGADVTRYVKSRGEGVYRGLLRRGDLFMPVSQDFARRIERMGADPRKVVVHRTGIDLRLFAYRSRAAGSTPLHLVTVARLVEKKGIEYVVRAVARLAAEGADVRYTIVGDGVLRESLARLAGELGVSECVHLAGWRPQREVRDIMDRADVLVAPSVTAASGDQEGIPNAVKEGMALGLPVVSTQHSGIPELVEDGVSGFLVPERDDHALAASIRTIRDSADLRRSMGRAGRTRVEREYDIERLNDALEAHYERLLERPNASAFPAPVRADVG
jgi:colanic acid/amylovoran biosynthesis glycosyltransferase